MCAEPETLQILSKKALEASIFFNSNVDGKPKIVESIIGTHVPDRILVKPPQLLGWLHEGTLK